MAQYLQDFTDDTYENYYMELKYTDPQVDAPFWWDDRNDQDSYAGYNAAVQAIDYGTYTDPRIYARTTFERGVLAIQYWFFYPLDRNHEGDWEWIQLEFDSDGETNVDKLTQNILRHRIAPTRAIFSSHGLLTNAECWSAGQGIQHENFNIYVYPAHGSHANYYAPGSFRLFLDAFDVSNSFGTTLVPPGYAGGLANQSEYDVVLLDDSDNGTPWLRYAGKWGEQTGKGFTLLIPVSLFPPVVVPKTEVIGDGPPGPAHQPIWDNPQWWRGIRNVNSYDARVCNDGKTLVSQTGTQSIGNKQITIDADQHAEGQVTLEFSYDALDAIQPGLEIQIGSTEDESDLIALSAVRAIQGVVDVVMYDVSLNQDLGETTTLCIKEPASFPLLTELQLWHFDSETLQWNKLNTNVVTIDGEKFACGETTSFSFFALTAINPVLEGRGGSPKLASHIQPNVTSITISPSDTVRLSTNIFGQQDILDNSLAENLTFEWDLDGTTIDGDGHEIEFTAPESPGRYTVTATLPDTECNAKHGSCSVEFNIRVRRPRSVDPAVDVSEPVNPAGQIPIVIPGADGTQHAVFTPVEGGSVKSGSCTFEAPSGAINDNEFIGIAVQTTDDPTQLTPVDDPRFVTQDSQCDLSAVDNAGTNIADYRLRVPGDVCIPVPDEYRSNAFDIRLLSVDNGQTQILATRVIINDPQIPLKLCGKLSTLPNTVFAALPANLAPKIPTPEIVGDEVTTPDTGPSAIPPMATWFILVLGIALLVFVTTVKLKNHNFRRSRR